MTIRAFYLRNFILLSVLLLLVADYNTNLLSAAPATDSPGGGNLIWAKRAGGAGNEYITGITTLSNDSIVITGGFSGSTAFGEGESNATILTSSGEQDVFIARYNPDGTLAWAKRAGMKETTHSSDITALSDDSVVVTGGYTGKSIFGQDEPNQTILPHTGDHYMFVARYNPNGTLAWVKSAGGKHGTDSHTITALSDNSTVVTGYFWESSKTFGSGEPNQTVLNCTGEADIFIAKYNPDGSLAWAKRAGGSDFETITGITTLSDNSTVITGYSDGSVTFGSGELNETVLASGELNIFIARYNPDGTLEWAKQAGGPSSYAESHGIASLSDDSILVTGNFGGSITFGQREANQTALKTNLSSPNFELSAFIARYNPDGTFLWVKSASGASYAADFSVIKILSDNSAIVTGYFKDSITFGKGEVNETVLTTESELGVFLAQYSSDGTFLWVKQIGGKGEWLYTGYAITTMYEWPYGYATTTLSDDSTVVYGVFKDSITFGKGEPNETTLNSAGGGDIFITRFAP